MRSGHAHRRGITLLEVLVALTVFGLVTVVIFSVFSTAVRTQNVTDREVELIRRARVVMDAVERDLANVFFRDETSYNVTISRLLEEQERERLVAEAEGDWSRYIELYGDPFSDRQGARDEQPSIGDPFERGRLIDIQFQGNDGGDFDSMTFATHQPLGMAGRYRPWGLSRVTYSVDNNNLIRVEDSVESNRTDLLGNLVVKDATPSVARLAEGVQEFNLSYAFWFDNHWFEIEDWSSTRRQVRNSNYLLGSYREESPRLRDDDSTAELRPGDPGYNERLNFQDNQMLDRLPAYVRLRMVLTDPEREGIRRAFERVFRVYPAEETYLPNPELAEDERDMELEERMEIYSLVFPGALEDYWW